MAKDESKPAPQAKAKYSAPIKAELIGTDNDAQLKAALAYLQGKLRDHGRERLSGRQPPRPSPAAARAGLVRQAFRLEF